MQDIAPTAATNIIIWGATRNNVPFIRMGEAECDNGDRNRALAKIGWQQEGLHCCDRVSFISNSLIC